jgi:glycosyltransferase involved in cell wall biosynthesis
VRETDSCDISGIEGDAMMGDSIVKYSFLIPVKDEEENLPILIEAIGNVMYDIGVFSDFQIVFVDDGSTDNSLSVMKYWEPGSKASLYRVLELRKNFGKSAALALGLRYVRGKYVIMMDADMQDDPSELPKFFKKMEKENADCVVGWRRHRQDNASKLIPSKFFNWLTSAITGVPIHDSNCGFKMMTAEAANNLLLYGEMHRYIPSILHLKGFKVTEVEIKHNKRLHGQSKYGWSRIPKGMLDLISVAFISRFRERPAHFFCGLSIPFFMLSSLFILGAVYRWAFTTDSVSTFLIMTTLTFITGLLLFLIGMLGELIIQKKPDEVYMIKNEY